MINAMGKRVDTQTVIFPKEKFKTREAVESWLNKNDFSIEGIVETAELWRAPQRQVKEFKEASLQTIDLDEKKGVKAVIGIPSNKEEVAKKRERTKEFLEAAFARARKVLNPRDFAMIFQASRASAGGQITARRRRERISAAEKQLIDKVSLKDMSKAELKELAGTLNKAYERSKKLGNDTAKVLSRAASLREEFRRRELGDPDGPVYVELKKRGKKDVRKFVSKEQKAVHNRLKTSVANGTVKKPNNCDHCKKKTKSFDLHAHHTDYSKPDKVSFLCRPCHGAVHATKKGFINGEPDGGFHAHGLDRRNSKTLDDGGHMHLWVLPSTGETAISNEDGFHAHAIGVDGNTTSAGGSHSHQVLLSNGAVVETKLGGDHTHGLMVETSGFDGSHTHMLVMPDGTELESMTPGGFAAALTDPPASHPLLFASEISRAMLDLRAEREAAAVGSPLPSSLPDLAGAVELAVKGETVAPPTFTVEVDGDLMEVRVGGEVVGLSKHVAADGPEDIVSMCAEYAEIVKHTSQVPFRGPVDAKLMFVAAAPNELELARKQAIVGEDALIFQSMYLDPLNLKSSEVALGFAMPTLPHEDLNPALCEKWNASLVTAMKTYRQAKIVALGKVARDVLKSAGVEFWSLPHPSAVRKHGDSGEVSRKLKAIGKALDASPKLVPQSKNSQKSTPSKGAAPATLADAISETRKTGHTVCRVVKSAEEKQIVYGVVLDPYDVDLQTEWVPPAEIESTAHGFLTKSRVIGFEHVERAEAQIVESWVEAYPSPADYEAAKENRPHRAFTRKFGDDVIHSGTWVAGVKLGDREWELHKQGKLNAFSVGGFSFKTKVTTAAMPEVEFIELVGLPA